MRLTRNQVCPLGTVGSNPTLSATFACSSKIGPRRDSEVCQFASPNHFTLRMLQRVAVSCRPDESQHCDATKTGSAIDCALREQMTARCGVSSSSSTMFGEPISRPAASSSEDKRVLSATMRIEEPGAGVDTRRRGIRPIADSRPPREKQGQASKAESARHSGHELLGLRSS